MEAQCLASHILKRKTKVQTSDNNQHREPQEKSPIGLIQHQHTSLILYNKNGKISSLAKYELLKEKSPLISLVI